MNVRALLFSATAACVALPCAAQTYVIPNGFGGYTVQSPGQTTYATPNGFGGYYLNSPTIRGGGLDPSIPLQAGRPTQPGPDPATAIYLMNRARRGY